LRLFAVSLRSLRFNKLLNGVLVNKLLSGWDSNMEYKYKNPLITAAYQKWRKSKQMKKYNHYLLICDALYLRKQITDSMLIDFLQMLPLFTENRSEEILKKLINQYPNPFGS